MNIESCSMMHRGIAVLKVDQYVYMVKFSHVSTVLHANEDIDTMLFCGEKYEYS